MASWPKDTQEARNAFYGDPGQGQIEPQMVDVIPPFRMTYTDDDGRVIVIKNIRFHRKCADALRAVLAEIWDYCDHDQAKVDASGASKYFGAYNKRMVRGSTTKWSNHAYAAAIDLNAGQNALGTIGNMPEFIVDAFVRQGAMWGGWYKSRPDWMHFEFVDNGGRQPKSPPPGEPREKPMPQVSADLRTRMGRTILGYEARRDSQGRLAVYRLPANDGGGTYEVAGINDRYHPQEAAKLRGMIEAGDYAAAEAEATEYMAAYTDGVAAWSQNAGVQFYCRDCAFNRGPTGAAKILQMALGVDADGVVGKATHAALDKADPGWLIEKMRAAREQYELKVAGRRENLWNGLVNRWNKSLADAKKFAAEAHPGSEIVVPPITVPPPGAPPRTDLAPTFFQRVMDLFKPPKV